MERSQGRGIARCGLFLPLVSVLVLICASQDAAEAVQHQVGGTPGWSLPSLANVNYTTWASTQTFSVGDALYFNYSSQYHNVLQVTEVKYDKCSTSSPMTTWDNGATIVQLNTTGTFYFICGFPGHCDAGQKVAVLVQAASSSSPTAAPQTPTNSAAVPPSSSPIAVPQTPTNSVAAPPSATTLSLLFLLSLSSFISTSFHSLYALSRSHK